jgi:hypothetical protein
MATPREEELQPLAPPAQQNYPHQAPQSIVHYNPNNVYPAAVTFYQVQPGGPDAKLEFLRRLRQNYPITFVAVLSPVMLVINLALFFLVAFYNIKLNNDFNTINAMFVSKYVATVSLTNSVYAVLALITSMPR